MKCYKVPAEPSLLAEILTGELSNIARYKLFHLATISKPFRYTNIRFYQHVKAVDVLLTRKA
jgi:hypothetical protein